MPGTLHLDVCQPLFPCSLLRLRTRGHTAHRPAALWTVCIHLSLYALYGGWPNAFWVVILCPTCPRVPLSALDAAQDVPPWQGGFALKPMGPMGPKGEAPLSHVYSYPFGRR